MRDEHAARGGQRFHWGSPPDGEHPGEDYNCRCWAEPLNPSRHVWAGWAREQGRMRAATLQDLAPPLGLNDGLTDLMTPIPLDAIESLSIAFDAAAILMALQLGKAIPISAIIVAVRSEKIAQNIRHATIDSKIFERPKGIPKNWEAVSTRTGTGVVYKHPKERETYVKVQKARPQSKKPGQQYDNVRWQKNKQSFDIHGNPVKKNSQESHIPLKDFKFNLEKMK